MRRTWVLTMCICVASCGGKAPADKPVAATKSEAGPKFDGPDKVAGSATTPAQAVPPAQPVPPTQPAAEPKAPGPAPAADEGKAAEPDLGQRFVDPRWFRKTLFEDAVNSDFKRSQVDDKGLFSSQFLFDLADGTTSDDCAKHLLEKVGGAVPNLSREDTEERITIRGNTDRYTVTMVCGEAKGMMKAYVSFSWTS